MLLWLLNLDFAGSETIFLISGQIVVKAAPDTIAQFEAEIIAPYEAEIIAESDGEVSA